MIVKWLLVVVLLSASAVPMRALGAWMPEVSMARICAAKAVSPADKRAFVPAELPMTGKGLRAAGCEPVRALPAGGEAVVAASNLPRYARPQSDAEQRRAQASDFFRPPRG